MKVIALEIPDDPAALPGWLERRMVGLDLAALAAELEAIHGPEPPGTLESLDALLGDRRDAVLEMAVNGFHGFQREFPERILLGTAPLLELLRDGTDEVGAHLR